VSRVGVTEVRMGSSDRQLYLDGLSPDLAEKTSELNWKEGGERAGERFEASDERVNELEPSSRRGELVE
jgi:hypothetical protein